MGNISKDTAWNIAVAYQEIERGETLLEDVRTALATRKDGKWAKDGHEPDLRDVFGSRQRSLQLGVPSGENGHKICGVSYDLAVPIIEAHIANERARLAALSLRARTELDSQD